MSSLHCWLNVDIKGRHSEDPGEVGGPSKGVRTRNLVKRPSSNPNPFSLSSQDERTKVDVILEVLEATAGKERLDWVLWAEQNALVLNPAYTFPFSKYTGAGHSIVMYGNPEDAVAGNVNGAHSLRVRLKASIALICTCGSRPSSHFSGCRCCVLYISDVGGKALWG